MNQLYKAQEQAQLIYGDRNQNRGSPGCLQWWWGAHCLGEDMKELSGC